jgi:hypothetical protein
MNQCDSLAANSRTRESILFQLITLARMKTFEDACEKGEALL